MKRTLAVILASAMLLLCLGSCGNNQGSGSQGGTSQGGTSQGSGSGGGTDIDYPTRDISMIIPFSAGGATDLIGRALATGMGEYLGVNIAVTDMPGSASAVGTEYVMDSEHDGYTILCQPTDITSIAIMGQSELTYEDWNTLYVATAVPTVICVPPDSPINTVEDLVAAMKERVLTIATSDSGCAFTRGVGLILQQEPDCQTPQLIPSGGGGNAALSAVKGDVDASACGLPECIEYVRSGDLKPITYFGASDITVTGSAGDVHIPWVCEAYPQLESYMPFGGWVGMAVPADTDPAIAAKLTEAVEYAANTDEFIDFLKSKEFVPMSLKGDEANAWAESTTYTNAWLLYDMGFTSTSPEEFGWPRPEN